MKTTMGELKRIVRETISETIIRTRDGQEWEGARNSISDALVGFGSTSAERDAILAGKIPINPQALSSLKSKGIVKKVAKPEQFKDTFASPTKGSYAKVQKTYEKAVKAFAENWTNFSSESPDSSPEESASDAAEGFFFENPQWQVWARELGMSKSEMKEAVADFVYQAMKTGRVK